MAFGFGSPASANQLAALGAMQGAMPTGNPLQSMAPVIPGYQGSGGGMMRMMPMMPGAPQRPQGSPANGLMGMNPQALAALIKAFQSPTPSTGTVAPGTISMGYSNPFAAPASSAGGPPLAY